MDPLQNTTFWPVNYQISTKLSPTLTDYCGSAVHLHAFIFTGWIGEVMERRAFNRNMKSIYLLLPAYSAPMQVKNVLKFQEYSILGVRLWLSRIRSDLVTAQVDLSIKLESTQNDSALYLCAVWRFGRLINPLLNRTFWPVNNQISTKLSPNLTDYCESAVHAHAFIYTGWIGDGS